ncbi:MAG: hypothetical protein M0R44_08590, partial [Candidatus Marinimicrobia bacterium]|nr:hypothetical protein [Candidatus Neomarinimicrobiota bacterium]
YIKFAYHSENVLLSEVSSTTDKPYSVSNFLVQRSIIFYIRITIKRHLQPDKNAFVLFPFIILLKVEKLEFIEQLWLLGARNG